MLTIRQNIQEHLTAHYSETTFKQLNDNNLNERKTH